MKAKINFTFKKTYRFLCQPNCGMCCFQKGLLLTQVDFERIRNRCPTELKVKTTIAPGFDHEIILEEGVCPFLVNARCSIYAIRPIICRLYPFTIAFSPRGELFVNLIRCPGVGTSKGSVVNEQTLRQQLAEIEGIDPFFLKRMKKIETATFPQDFFDMKRLMFSKISEWVSCSLLKRQSIKTKAEALAHAFVAIVANKELGRLSVLKSDLQRTILTVEDTLMKQLVPSLKFVSERQKRQMKRVLKKGITKLTFDGKERVVSLYKIIDFYDLCGKIIKVRPIDLLEEKKTSERAEKLFEEHLREILTRVGGGGMPIDAELVEVVECVRQYCTGLDTYSRVYSLDESVISERSAELAIQNLDTKMVFTGIYKSIYDAYHKG